jgi:sigma-B regulation protein RsbU (phosphoserine phosphatase)
MPADAQVVELLQRQLPAIVLGTVFTFVGLASCAAAPFARAGSSRLLTWFGLFSAVYGLRLLAGSDALVSLLPHGGRPLGFELDWMLTYSILTPAGLFFAELSRGGLQRLLRGIAAAGAALAVVGITALLRGSPPATFMLPNNLLAITMVLSLAAVALAPPLARRYLRFTTPVFTAGLLIVVAAVLYTNLLPPARRLEVEPLALAVFLGSLGYTTLRQVFRNERALLSLEKELEIARDIQRSILPAAVPAVSRLGIAAAYRPMTAVAGDFYEFLPLDGDRAGFLIADVCGHGVPAALVASMVKAAVLSLSSYADDPSALLRELNRMFAHSLRSQLVTAAYLYLDTTAPRALYSAAGHPPLLYWDESRSELRAVESNGLLLGVAAEAEYPVCSLVPRPGDRFLLYTDGLIEAVGATGEPFGERALAEVVRGHHRRPAAELSAAIEQTLTSWRPPARQQDDVTWLVVDVL